MPVRPEYSTYLLIYAPRREVLEVWPARSGKSLRTYKCGSNCVLMSPAVTSASFVGEAPVQDCFVLSGATGQLFSVAERLAAT
jgi:Rab3 GTPase-activating protein regulatory subunit N-terminus